MTAKDVAPKRWLAEQRRLFIDRYRFIIVWAGAPLVLGFSFIDFIYIPEKAKTLLAIRATVIPAVLICFALGKIRRLRRRFWEIPALVFLVYLGIYSAALVQLTGVEQSPYYSGINLIAVGSLCFIPWTLPSMLVSIFCVYAPYAGLLILNAGKFHFAPQLPSIAFMASTLFLGVIGHIMFKFYRRNAHDAAQILRMTIADQDKTIKEKSREAVALSYLTKQFSPQVVKAINDGVVNVDAIVRREVSVLFVDVKGSTERANRIDHDAWLDVILDLYKNVNRIFLSHGLTVGTFLGDGALAFCNAPAQRADHVAATIHAALDIQEFCTRKKAHYSEIWRKPFFVRLGVNVGYCDVGFFPSAELGTYTVLGDTVNQASRFCSSADPNTICVPKAVLRKAESMVSTLDLARKQNSEEIKGLEGEFFDLFCIRGRNGNYAVEKKYQSCPLCSGQLRVKEKVGDAVYIVCSSPCKYMDIVDQEFYDEALSGTS